MKTPTILWRHITNIASGHSSLVVRDPYPIVCWVSTEKRKHPVKELTLLRQGTNGSEGFSGGLRSPWVKMISHQMSAKRSQERMKERANTSSVQRHCTSTRVVKMSWRYRRLRLATFHWTTLQSPCLKMTRLRTRLAAYRALRYLQDGNFYFRHSVNTAMCGRSLSHRYVAIRLCLLTTSCVLYFILNVFFSFYFYNGFQFKYYVTSLWHNFVFDENSTIILAKLLSIWMEIIHIDWLVICYVLH